MDYHRDKKGSIICCEHNREGLRLYSLYGRFTVYTCALDLRRGRHWLAGWNEPCFYICRSALAKGTKYINYCSEIPKNEERIRSDKEEGQENLQKAKRLRAQADGLLTKAIELEK